MRKICTILCLWFCHSSLAITCSQWLEEIAERESVSLVTSDGQFAGVSLGSVQVIFRKPSHAAAEICVKSKEASHCRTLGDYSGPVSVSVAYTASNKSQILVAIFLKGQTLLLRYQVDSQELGEPYRIRPFSPQSRILRTGGSLVLWTPEGNGLSAYTFEKGLSDVGEEPFERIDFGAKVLDWSNFSYRVATGVRSGDRRSFLTAVTERRLFLCERTAEGFEILDSTKDDGNLTQLTSVRGAIVRANWRGEGKKRVIQVLTADGPFLKLFSYPLEAGFTEVPTLEYSWGTQLSFDVREQYLTRQPPSESPFGGKEHQFLIEVPNEEGFSQSLRFGFLTESGTINTVGSKPTPVRFQ